MLTLSGVSKTYPHPDGPRPVLRDVSMRIETGEVLGLVGESGAGKSTLGRCILGLERPDRGRMDFQGVDLARLDAKGFRRLYSRIQMIFQDPRTHLNPHMRIKDLVREPLDNLTRTDRPTRERRVSEILDQVGLRPDIGERYPRQLSGGQCQRAAIARALVVRPEFLVCDEALSAQDALLQLQILNLLRSLITGMRLTCLFITHDLTLARYFCGRIAVMQEGRIVEQGRTADIFARPQAAYTRMLISHVLDLNPVTGNSSRDGVPQAMNPDGPSR